MSLTDVSVGISDVIAAFGRSITFRKRTIGARNNTALTTAVTNTDYTVSALRYDAQTSSFGYSPAPANALMYEYRFLKSGLDSGNTSPTEKDIIIDGGFEYGVTSVDTSADSLAWIVKAQIKK